MHINTSNGTISNTMEVTNNMKEQQKNNTKE
jgi:hypothetical protein